jgi:ubiquinone biosynthesis protein
MWVTAEPVVRSWIERKLGPVGKLEEASDGMMSLGRMALQLPEVLGDAQKATRMLSDMAKGGGIRLDATTTAEIAKAQLVQRRWFQYAVMAGAVALVVIAVKSVV